MRKHAALLTFAFVCFSTYASGQAQEMVCDLTCAPNPASADYTPTVTSRIKVENMRARHEQSPAFPAGEGDMSTQNLIGSQSVDYAIPIINLPGRAGLDLNLGLRYNSRIWTVNPDVSPATITLNADRDFPSYGFRLDYGFIEDDTANSGSYFVTESDGTKHELTYSTGTLYDSTDGSHIEYNTSSKVLYYPNGLQLTYEVFPSVSTLYRVNRITDTNGNYISVTYVTGHDQNIDTITDTLGRVITYHYTSNQLSSITEALASGSFTLASFTWTTVTLSYNFSITVANSPATTTVVPVLESVKLPDGTYYKFSYTGWGIANRIEHFSANTLTATSRGYSRFDFPSTSTSLSDAPGYTHEYVSTDGGSTEHTWTYTVNKSGTVVTDTTVQDPSGTKTVMTLAGSSDPCPGAVATLQIKDSGSTTLRQVDNTYDSSCQLTQAITTLSDSAQKSKVTYSYDSFGNVTNEKVYDFGSGAPGSLLRETATYYPTSPSDHVLNLPSKVEIYNGGGTKVSRTDFAYDETTPSSVTGGTPPQHTSASTRGNLTTVTRYTNAPGASGAISRTFAYDEVGNMVTGHFNCCVEKTFSYTATTKWAYPETVTRDPSGLNLQTSATYDFYSGLVTASTDENSKSTSYSYDSARRTYQVTQPNSVVLTTTYDDTSANPAVTQSNSANSLVTITTMDGVGNVLERDIKNSSTLVSKVTYTLDGLGRVTQQTNPYTSGSPAHTDTAYDALGRVSTVTPPSAGYYGYAYSGNSTTTTDPTGKQRRTFNDSLGRLTQVDEPTLTTGVTISGTEQSFTTDASTHASGTVTVTGTEQSYYQDGDFYCAEYEDPGVCVDWEQYSGSTFYDSGRVTITVNGHPDFAYYTYGSDATSVAVDLTNEINGDSGASVTASRSGTVITLTSKTTGSSTNYMLSVSHSSDDSAHFSPPSFDGSPSGSALTGGTSGSTTTNDTGHVSVTVNGVTESVTYNGSDSTSAIATNLANAFNSDSASPVTATASANVITFVATSFTGNSESVSTGHTTDYPTHFGSPSYSASGSNLGASLTVPATTSYTYRATGELTGVSSGSQSRTYSYDDLGRATSVSLPESGTTSYTYYDHGRVHTRTDARNVVTTYTYNNVYQPYQIAYDVSGASGISAPGTVTFTYGTSPTSNNNGRLTNMSDGSGSEAYTYDNMGRVTSVAKTISSVTYTTNYSYNTDSTLDTLTYPSGRAIAQTYDGIGRLDQIKNSGSAVLTVGGNYNEASQPTAVTYGNGATGAFTYNDHLQLASLTYKNASAATILGLTYGYGTNNNGQIASITDAAGADKSVTYTYDPLGRLSSASTGNTTSANTWAISWTYDRYGNRLSQYQSAGLLSSTNTSLTVSTTTNRITTSPYAYDANGNMTEDGITNTYSYDAENHMVGMGVSGGGSHTYLYDGNNLRVKKDSTVYIYSGAKVIAEYASGAAATSPSTEYVYSGSSLLQTISGSTTTYHHPDHLSNRLDTNSSGAPTGTFGHLPFGDNWYGSGSKWKFTSYERDSESGLDYAINRYHSSAIGRFMSPDRLAGRIGNPQSLNRYSYTLNDPVNLTDPLGLDGCLHSTGATPADCIANGGLWLDHPLPTSPPIIQVTLSFSPGGGGSSSSTNAGTSGDSNMGGASFDKSGGGDGGGDGYSQMSIATPELGMNNGGGAVSTGSGNGTFRPGTLAYNTFNDPIWPVASNTVNDIGAGYASIYAGIFAVPEVFSAATAGVGRVLFGSTLNRVFWSGAGYFGAHSYALMNEGTTLEMTPVGRFLEFVGEDVHFETMRPLWNAASAAFARGAQGPVLMFEGMGGFQGETWREIESVVLSSRGITVYSIPW